MKCNVFRFIYLNTYGLMLIGISLAIVAIPLYLFAKWMLLIQIPVSAIFIFFGIKLLCSWPSKKRSYEILKERNAETFRPETFKIYMEAPCGRKLTHVVLEDLGYKERYSDLLIYKPTFAQTILSICATQQDDRYSIPGEVKRIYTNFQ